LIPHKKSAYKNCRKKLLIEVSRFVDPIVTPCSACDDLNTENKIVTFYKSRSDLIKVVRASSFLSGVSAPTDCTLEMRNKPTCDGGFSTVEIPCPKNSKHCVRVSAYVVDGTKPEREANIFPGMRGEDTLPYSAKVWADISLDAVRVNAKKEEIFEFGYLDAKHWMEQNGF
jgi:hypothetical protein